MRKRGKGDEGGMQMERKRRERERGVEGRRD